MSLSTAWKAGATGVLIGGLLGSPLTAESTGRADRVFLNGRVWTADPGRPFAEALAVRGTTLLAVGGSGALRRFAGKGTEVVDLAGAFVAPGFIDSRLNLLAGGWSLERLDLEGAETPAQVGERVRAWLAAHRDSPWLIGRGWRGAVFDGGLPTKEALDAIAGERLVWLVSQDGQLGWTDSATLRLAGIGRDTPDPEGGAIVRAASGEPTGVLLGSAKQLIERLLPKPIAHHKRRALSRAIAQAAAWGLTSVHDAGLDEADIEDYAWALDEARQLRVYATLELARVPDPERLERQRLLRERFSSRWLRLGAVATSVDGRVETRTAALFEPYLGGGTGLIAWTQDALDRAVAAYDAAGWQVLLHAAGDRGVEMALLALERAARANGTKGRRHRIAGLELVRAADLARLRAAGIVASTQAPLRGPGPRPQDTYLSLVGPERATRALPLRAIDEAGVRQVFGSDWPNRSADVLQAIQGAVTHMAGGAAQGRGAPAASPGFEAALRHHTVDGAFAENAEGEKGRLAPGLAADFVVLSQDPLALPPDKLGDVRLLRTVLAGQDTFRAGGGQR